jgi:hypothetical protein
VKADEMEYRLIDPMGSGTGAAQLSGAVALSQCHMCHAGDGIFSVNTYNHRFSTSRSDMNPQLFPIGEPGPIGGMILGDQSTATVEWKKRQYNCQLSLKRSHAAATAKLWQRVE